MLKGKFLPVIADDYIKLKFDGQTKQINNLPLCLAITVHHPISAKYFHN